MVGEVAAHLADELLDRGGGGVAGEELREGGPAHHLRVAPAEAARARGYTVETIIGLDAATEATNAFFHQKRFDHWDRRIMQERDLGRVRNEPS